MKFKQNIGALAAALAWVCTPSSAWAEKFTASQWLPPTYAQSMHAYKGMFDRVREATKGAVDVETFYSGSLLPAKTTITGVRDGAADIGFVYPAYTPAELPVASFINSVNFNSTDALVSALAFTEMGYTNAALKTELDRFNVMLGGTFVTPPYQFMCATPVNTLAQAKGKRFRTAGAAFTGLTEAMQGSAVSVPIGDVYSGMQRGSIDCVIADATNLTTASFNEVTKDITSVTLGGATGFQWVIRKDRWKKISPAHRALMLDEMVLAIVRTQAEWDKQVAAAMADADKRGIKSHPPAADLGQLIADYKKQFTEKLLNDPKALPNAKALLEEYQALQAKWTQRLQGVNRQDEAAVLAVAKKELHSKMDKASFGL